MKTKQIFCIFAVLLAVSFGAFAQSKKSAAVSVVAVSQKGTPEELLKELYAIHTMDLKNEQDRIVNAKSRRNLDKFFDKNLADLIWKDMTTVREGVGVIDFDIFYNTQDPQITNLTVGKAQINGEKATVQVNFKNANTKEKVTYLLVKENAKWKIRDIKYGGNESLLKYFEEDANGN
ncbi:MAG TPA: DUF3828 domain-containing protein [Pyrinomonadaceae bacterium]|nr:DUF3828 domain-containing protein [Pyrinomonadaceae bacterium]